MARDLYNIYHKRSDYDLKKMRSKKFLRLTKLNSRRMGWLDLREAESLRNQIKAIDSELGARLRTDRLFL